MSYIKMFTLIQIKDKLLNKDAAVLLLFISLILLFGIVSYKLCTTYKDEDNIGSLTGGIVICFVSAANTILLYLTLTSQHNGLENEKSARIQERFETTFFNLLESQRKLTNEIFIETNALDNNLNVVQKQVRGRRFFTFAIKELGAITDALESNVETKYIESDKVMTIEAFECKWSKVVQPCITTSDKQKEWKRLDEKFRIEFSNLFYNINMEHREKYHSDKSVPYNLFRRKWYNDFEHYIRNLYYILYYINEEQKDNIENKKKYIRFVQSQMSRVELNLIQIHAQAFPLFLKILNDSHLTEITTNNE